MASFAAEEKEMNVMVQGGMKQRLSVAEVGRENLYDVIKPHKSYEGAYRFDPSARWTRQEEAAIVRKCDLFLLTWVCLMFFCLQIDRGNLSNALVDNLAGDLGMTTNDYNNGTAVLLVAFMITEFPVQLITKRYGFKNVLPIMIMLWGTVSWSQAFMTNKAGFYITRMLLGATEGGFIPGMILLMTYFYTSKELSIRLSWIWATFNLAKVVSALLAAGILRMEGITGRPGWFWLFLLEGLMTFLVGFLSFLYLPNSPVRTTGFFWRKPWFTEREEVIMINRLLRDDSAKGLTDLTEPATWKDIKAAWADKAMWGFYLMGLVVYVPALPVSGYLALTLRRLGFSTFDSNMLAAPYAVLQIILMLALSKSSEYFDERGIHCLIGEFWMMPLFAALLALPAHGHAWGRFVLTTMISGYPYFHPIVSAWVSENSFDVKKRAITAATYNVCVQIGGIISTQCYQNQDAPYYYIGNRVLISLCVFSMFLIVGQKLWLMHLNRVKLNAWNAMALEEQVGYQNDQVAREKDGNKRFDMFFKT